MSALTKFRDHCAAMATAEHKPECPSLTARKPPWPPGGWVPTDAANLMRGLTRPGPEPAWVPPTCDGCVTDADRALFGRMASEAATYIDAQLNLTERAK